MTEIFPWEVLWQTPFPCEPHEHGVPCSQLHVPLRVWDGTLGLHPFLALQLSNQPSLGKETTLPYTSSVKWGFKGRPSYEVVRVSVTSRQSHREAFVVTGGGASSLSNVAAFADMLNCSVRFGKLLRAYCLL